MQLTRLWVCTLSLSAVLSSSCKSETSRWERSKTSKRVTVRRNVCHSTGVIDSLGVDTEGGASRRKRRLMMRGRRKKQKETRQAEKDTGRLVLCTARISSASALSQSSSSPPRTPPRIGTLTAPLEFPTRPPPPLLAKGVSLLKTAKRRMPKGRTNMHLSHTLRLGLEESSA